MKRTGVWAAALFVFSSFIVVFAQQPAQFPNLPANVIGPQLVAWSELQKPQPTPQPLPPPERADQSQTDQSQAEPPQAQPQQPSIQFFVGTIIKDGSKYVLKVSENVSYPIDDQEKAKIYEGKQVKISGRLDGKTNLLHITSIELLS
jgi:hypothetical protein